jgi:hypothetical protein
VTEIIDPVSKARALQELARKLPPDAKNEASLFWENDHGTAGVALSDNECVVFLFNAQRPVESMYEAADLLKAILADEIVSVTGYYREQFAFCRLAPADAVGLGVPPPGRPGFNESTPSDSLVVETWSRGVIKDE